MLDLSVADGYALSIAVLMLSAFVSGLELASAPGLSIDFVFPTTARINKRAIWIGLNLAQALLAACSWILFRYADRVYFRGSFLILAAVVAVCYQIRTAGKDGADQVRMLAFGAYSLGFLLEGIDEERIPMYFMGAQILIGYAAAGIVKASSPYWRKGDVVSQILSTYSFGLPRVGQFLAANPLLDKAASYSPIALMLFVPLAFFLPFQTPLLVALTAMFSFHLLAALLMGLNDFVITFPLAYPGVLLLHALLFDSRA